MKQLRVLYVEDDQETRESLTRFLKPRVGRIYQAADGEEALAKFHEVHPNVLIVDLIMPGMSGLELIGAVRETDRACPILVTSTVSEVETVLQAVDQKIQHYVIKPIDPNDLEKKLQTIASDLKASGAVKDELILDNPGLVEDMIRRHFIKLLKSTMGKGPLDMKIHLTGNQLEIHVIDGITTMEKTILENRRNSSAGEQFRRLFYEEIAEELEALVGLALGNPVRLTAIRVDGQKRNDRLTLTIDRQLW